ncbi:MAG TPA: metallophosphoesterase [Syntrophorhabdaceae bacterium]|nr:metallophosphoesterase [Syntrophorhabdaceae bacterium]
MKIGVLSDTHLTHVTDHFRKTMRTAFQDVQMIIHAGDITAPPVYDYLSNWELKAVKGNMDDYELQRLLPARRIEEIAGRKIGVMHGNGSPQGIEERVFREFQDVDVIIFGHSHVPFMKRKGDVFLFNPGSFRGSYSHPGTVGLITIGEEIALTHIEVE